MKQSGFDSEFRTKEGRLNCSGKAYVSTKSHRHRLIVKRSHPKIFHRQTVWLRKPLIVVQASTYIKNLQHTFKKQLALFPTGEYPG